MNSLAALAVAGLLALSAGCTSTHTAGGDKALRGDASILGGTVPTADASAWHQPLQAPLVQADREVWNSSSTQSRVWLTVGPDGLGCHWDAAPYAADIESSGFGLTDFVGWCAFSEPGGKIAYLARSDTVKGDVLLLDQVPSGPLQLYLHLRATATKHEENRTTTTFPLLLAYGGVYVDFQPSGDVRLSGSLFGCDAPDAIEGPAEGHQLTDMVLVLRTRHGLLEARLDPSPSRIASFEQPPGVTVHLEDGVLVAQATGWDLDVSVPFSADLEGKEDLGTGTDGPHTCGTLLSQSTQSWTLTGEVRGAGAVATPDLDAGTVTVYLGTR